jgi:hypothetical protein
MAMEIYELLYDIRRQLDRIERLLERHAGDKLVFEFGGNTDTMPTTPVNQLISSDIDFSWQVNTPAGAQDPSATINSVSLTVADTLAADGTTAIDPTTFCTIGTPVDADDIDVTFGTIVGSSGTFTATAEVTFSNGESASLVATANVVLVEDPAKVDTLVFDFKSVTPAA